MSTQSSTPQQRARRRRDAWARRFRPSEVDLLIIAEAPPSSLDRYFYFPDVPVQDSLFREVAKALLKVQPAREDKRAHLDELKARGVFLIDASQEPLDGPLRIEHGRLVARIRRLRPVRIVVVKASVFDRIYEPLVDAGLPVVKVRVPFPGSGRQLEFHDAFRRALRMRPVSPSQ